MWPIGFLVTRSATVTPLYSTTLNIYKSCSAQWTCKLSLVSLDLSTCSFLVERCIYLIFATSESCTLQLDETIFPPRSLMNLISNKTWTATDQSSL